MGANTQRSWNSSLKRKTPLKSGGVGLKRTGFKKKLGRKGGEWEAAKRKLKVAFSTAGIQHCEFKYPSCWRSNALSFCHAKKRRNLTGNELFEVALGCITCHQYIEILPESEMTRIVREVIANRAVHPVLV